MSVVTCHTSDCGNAGEGIDMNLTYVDEAGASQTITDVFCGVCGQPITDIQGGTDE